MEGWVASTRCSLARPAAEAKEGWGDVGGDWQGVLDEDQAGMVGVFFDLVPRPTTGRSWWHETWGEQLRFEAETTAVSIEGPHSAVLPGDSDG